MDVLRAIGLMSGTSLDGIDAALLRTDGEGRIEREGFVSLPYDADLRARLRACLNAAPEKDVRAVEEELTRAHAEAVFALLKKTGIAAAKVDVIGFHGQTISHAPERGHTRQIGDGKILARMTGMRVVNDFRTADVKAGGQGAPLAPVYHRALASGLEKPVCFLNIGGVANVTYIGENGSLVAFDTGPGNALIDDWIFSKTGDAFDVGGKIASGGRADADILHKFFLHPFFAAKPPKSLDRDVFASQAWNGLSLRDGAATLTAFTVGAIARAQKLLPHQPKRWIVSGGGRLNAFLMKSLRGALAADVVAIEDMGLNGDAIEAEAFAYMAVRSLHKLPISFPTTTGVPQPMAGGRLHLVSDAA